MFPPASRSPMMPEPTTAARRKAVPTASATTRRARSGAWCSRGTPDTIGRFAARSSRFVGVTGAAPGEPAGLGPESSPCFPEFLRQRLRGRYAAKREPPLDRWGVGMRNAGTERISPQRRGGRRGAGFNPNTPEGPSSARRKPPDAPATIQKTGATSGATSSEQAASTGHNTSNWRSLTRV
jgi:hypothetical protein